MSQHGTEGNNKLITKDGPGSESSACYRPRTDPDPEGTTLGRGQTLRHYHPWGGGGGTLPRCSYFHGEAAPAGAAAPYEHDPLCLHPSVQASTLQTFNITADLNEVVDYKVL